MKRGMKPLLLFCRYDLCLQLRSLSWEREGGILQTSGEVCGVLALRSLCPWTSKDQTDTDPTWNPRINQGKEQDKGECRFHWWFNRVRKRRVTDGGLWYCWMLERSEQETSVQWFSDAGPWSGCIRKAGRVQKNIWIPGMYISADFNSVF